MLSQFLLAVPLWLLFEVGLHVAALIPKSKQSASEEINSIAPDQLPHD